MSLSLSIDPTPQEAEDWLIAYETKMAQIQRELQLQAQRQVKVPQWGDLGSASEREAPDKQRHQTQWHQERNYYGRC